jgi:hypothetical protein
MMEEKTHETGRGSCNGHSVLSTEGSGLYSPGGRPMVAWGESANPRSGGSLPHVRSPQGDISPSEARCRGRSFWLGVGLLLMLGFSVQAQGPLVDLALEAAVEPPGITPPDSWGTLTLTVTNLGPDVAGASPSSVGIFSNRFEYVEGVGAMIEFFNDSDCFFQRTVLEGIPGSDLIEIEFSLFMSDPLLPGETASCRARFYINPAAQGTIVNTWFVSPLLFEDPDPSNDTVSLFFQVSPDVIPTLSGIGLASLILGLVVSFLFIVRRRRLG